MFCPPGEFQSLKVAGVYDRSIVWQLWTKSHMTQALDVRRINWFHSSKKLQETLLESIIPSDFPWYFPINDSPLFLGPVGPCLSTEYVYQRMKVIVR